MMMSRLCRLVVFLAAILFTAVAIGLWIAPALVAPWFGLTPNGAPGLATLRADLAGLFAGLAVLAGLAAWTAKRTWCDGAAVMLAMVAFGRSLGWLGSGAAGGDVLDMAIEVGVVAALFGFARKSMPASAAARNRVRQPAWSPALDRDRDRADDGVASFETAPN